MGKGEVFAMLALYQYPCMNSVSDLYSTKRKSCRKKWLCIYFYSIFKDLFILLFIGTKFRLYIHL